MIRVLTPIGRSIGDQFRTGLALFLVAPAAVALVVVPEFAQHVAEIRLGMFDNIEAARAAAGDPIRWAFGYAKIAGLVLAFLACARAVWCRLNDGRWWDLREIAWWRFLAGLVLFGAVGSLAEPFAGLLPEKVIGVLRLVCSLVSMPFLFVMLAGLFGDRATGWRTLVLRSWPYVLLVLLLLVIGFGPAQLLHIANHKIALGAHPLLVWALMLWDSLVVGVLAALVGAGLAVSYHRFALRHSPTANHDA